MNEDLKKQQEENSVVDNQQDGTLASQVAPEEAMQTNATPDLTTSPVPTEEEVKEGNVAPEEAAPGLTVDETVNAVPAQDSTIPAATAEAKEELGATSSPARTFTQSQVDDIAGKTRTETRDKTFRYIYERYGVNSEAELDDLVGNAQRYDSLNERYENDKKVWQENDNASKKQLMELSEQVALMQSGIDNARYEDAKLILRGKGLDVNLDNINQELATHPEWRKTNQEEKPFVKTGEPMMNDTQTSGPETKISVLGNESNVSAAKEPSEEEIAMNRYFKL